MKSLLSRLVFLACPLLVFSGVASASTVQLAQTSYTVNENAGRVDIAVTVTRTLDANEVIQVDYATMDGTALAGRDYTATSGTLTFTSGVSSLTVSVPVNYTPGNNDFWPNGSGTFTFRISNPRSNRTPQPTINGSEAATVTILDVDGNRIGFTSTDYQVDEPAAAGQVRIVRLVVKRFGANTQPATIQYQTNNGTAVAGRDYFAQSGTLNFPNTSPDKPGEDAATQFIDITVLNDEAAEGNKTFTVTLSGEYGGSAPGISTTTVTIVDQATTTVRLSSHNYTVSETAGRVTISLVRNGNLNITGTVNLSTSDETAINGRNYTATSTDVVFNAGESAKSVDIPILNDNAVTGTLTFAVTLAPRSGGPSFLLDPQGSTARVSIIDAAPSNTVEFVDSDPAVPRGTGPAKIAVRLNRAPGNDQTVTVNYSTANSSGSPQAAVPHVDYTPVSGTLTFAPGQSLRIFEVPILDNTGASDIRRLVLNLSSPSANASLGVSTALLSILPANSAGRIQFSSSEYSAYENNGSVTLTVLLDRTGDTSRTVTVDYFTTPGSAGTNRFVPTSGRLTFANGASLGTITVPILNDTIVQQQPQSFFVTLSNPQNGSLGTPSQAEVFIQDDDGFNTVQFDSPEYGVVEREGAVQVRVRAQRGGDPNQILTVQIALGATGDTATNPEDYQTPSSTIVTFPAGVNVQSVTIPVTDNPAAQGVKTFTVRLVNPGPLTQIGPQSAARVTIFDNAGPNTVQFLATGYRLREGDQAAIGISVVRFGDFDVQGTTVTYTTELRAGDTAQPGVNFEPTSGSIRFAPLISQNLVVDNEHQKIIMIPIPNNTLIQGDVTFHVTLTGSDVAQFGNISTTKITIMDDDLGNVVRFSSSTYSVAENSGSAVLTVQLVPSGDASRPSTVDFAATPITAFAGFDFSPVTGTLIFAPGETTKSIIVPIHNDTVAEGPETFRVTLSNPNPGTIVGVPGTTIVTIIDDDVSSTIEFSPANYTVAENAGSVTLTLVANRQGDPSDVLTVGYETIGGTAVAGADFVSTSGTITFGPGETSRSITVQIIDDVLIEGTESFSVILSNPGPGVALGTSSSATIEIADNDSPTASIGFSAASYDVDEGAGFANLTVTRSGGLGVSATVNFTTNNGTALAGQNYQQTSGSVTFAVGEVSKVIQVPIIDDAVPNPTLSFTVTLTSANGTSFVGGQSTATVNIIDNDATTFRFNPTEYTVDEGSGNVTLTVDALHVGNPGDVLTVDYVTTDGTAVEGVRYQRTAGRLTFNAGVTRQTITVPIFDNTIKDGTQFFFVNLSNPQGGSMGAGAARIGSGRATVTIFDNDATTFQFSSPNYTVNNSSGSATLTVTLSRLINPNGVFTVDYSTSDITAQAGVDYTPTSGTLTFGPGETSRTILVALTPQPTGTPTRQFRVSLSNPSAGAELGTTSSAIVTVNNFDLRTKLRNISTRGPVETGDAVMIAGFIVQGEGGKQVALRGLGPSLTRRGVVNAVQDTTLQLMDANGTQIAYDDDYTSLSASDQETLSANGLTPEDTREAALVVTLNAGPHTVILRGKVNGVGLVEAYDLGATTTSRLVNISTRGKVNQGDNGALIAGFIVSAPLNEPGTAQEVVIRALGPSLSGAGVSNVLADPTLEVYRGSQRVFSNDDWKTQTGSGVGSRAAIESSGLKPNNDREAALLLTLDPGSYTAVVRGKNNTTGISLVEVYQVR